MIAETEGPSITPLSVRLAALTHPGGLPANEDACDVFETRQASVLIIADGAGGHAHGEVASNVVVQSVKARLAQLGRFKPAASVVEDLLRAAQDGLRDEITRHPKHYDMRSTVVVVLTTRDKVWVGHVGDSRAYLIRDGKPRLLTRDDTLVQTLVEIGQIDRQAAKKHSKANVLLQSIGDPRELDYHVSDAIDVRIGDVLVACSDGVTDVVDDDEIAALVADGKSRERAQRVIDRSIAKQSPDNVTAAVAVWRRSNGPPSVAVSRARPRTAARVRRRSRDTFPLIAAVCVLAAGLAAAAFAKYRHQHPGFLARLFGDGAGDERVPPPIDPTIAPAMAPGDASAATGTDVAVVPAAVVLDASAAIEPVAAIDAGRPPHIAAPVTTGRLYLVDLADSAQVFVDEHRVVPTSGEHMVLVPAARRVMVRIHREGHPDQDESIRIEAGRSFRLRAIRHTGSGAAVHAAPDVTIGAPETESQPAEAHGEGSTAHADAG